MAASAHVSITTASTVDWHVNLTTTAHIAMTPGLSYGHVLGEGVARHVMPIVAVKREGSLAAATSRSAVDAHYQ